MTHSATNVISGPREKGPSALIFLKYKIDFEQVSFA